MLAAITRLIDIHKVVWDPIASHNTADVCPHICLTPTIHYWYVDVCIRNVYTEYGQIKGQKLCCPLY